MEDDMISPDEFNSLISCVVSLNKKRKLQAELLGMPLPKRVCWGLSLEHEFSSDSIVEPMKVRSSIFPGGESDPESVSNSYSSPGDASSSMSSYASVEPSTSSPFRDGTSSRVYSSENVKLAEASSSKSESASFSEELHCPPYGYGLLPSDNYEDQLLGFESHGTENCAYKELENLLYSNGIYASNYVLSCGKGSVNQGGQEKTKKLTIDKEFEQYSFLIKIFSASCSCLKYSFSGNRHVLWHSPALNCVCYSLELQSNRIKLNDFI